MKEVGSRLKRDAEFVLPRTCKRPRSSVVYSKNSNWEHSHCSRRATVSPVEGLQSFLKAAARSEEQEEEDLDEIAMALLEMSSPAQKDVAIPRRATPPPSSSGPQTKARQASFPTAAAYSALQLSSNTLKSVPTIIITSGSSTDTGPTEVKSTSSDVIDAVNSIGQTGSPSSNQDSETVAYMLPRQSDRPAGIQRAQTCSFVAETSTQNAKQPITLGGANSLPNPTDGAFPPPKIGHTVSTGISLPRISQQANKQVRQETSPHAEAAGISHASLKPCNRIPSPDVHTQAMLQQLLHARLAGKGQLGRPIANSRGGKLIVMPDPPPKGANVEQADGKQTNLLRVPTLVLSTAQKPSAPRAASPALPTPSNPANPTNRSGGSIFQAQAQKAKPPQALQAALQQRAAPSAIVPGIGQQVNSNPVATDLVHRVQDGNRAAVSTTNNSTSSGDESSEEDWLPNWSLNLYNALNPTVITTGHLRSSSQALEGKAGSIVRCLEGKAGIPRG